MTQTIRSDSVSSGPTKSYKASFGDAGEASSRTRCQILAFENFQTSIEPPPKHFSTIQDLVGDWEQDPAGCADMEEGRRWVAEQFYGEQGETVRSLRLGKGWSQTHLAESMATSQSHIARIERGTENLTIETCRKLARALEIDLNRLDEALRRQEALVHARARRP